MRVFDRVNNVEGTTVTLNAKEGLRFRVIIMDLDNFFSYGRDFGMIIGKPNTTSSLPEYPISDIKWPHGFGTVPINNVYNTTPMPYFSITDKFSTLPIENSLEQVTDANIFTVSDNTFTFTPNLQPLLDNASIYVPQLPASNKYSPIIDTFSIQPGDLLRLGAFNSPVPDYYNIMSSSTSIIHTNEDNTTIRTNVVFVSNGIWPPFTGLTQASNLLRTGIPPTSTGDYRSYIIIPYWYTDANGIVSAIDRVGPGGNAPLTPTTDTFIGKIAANPTDAFRISGVSGPQAFKLNNLTCSVSTTGNTYAVGGALTYYICNPMGAALGTTSAYNNYYLYIPVSENLNTIPSGIPTIPATGSITAYTPSTSLTTGGVTCNITLLKDTYPVMTTVIVDRPITSKLLQPSQNFAILRPKPDETSVIVNFRKSAGDVSQTILIPQDANDEIKNKVGAIFSGLNTSLANQSQNYTQ
jgi:hypothetical protein